jgi:hypothetical protein
MRARARTESEGLGSSPPQSAADLARVHIVQQEQAAERESTVARLQRLFGTGPTIHAQASGDQSSMTSSVKHGGGSDSCNAANGEGSDWVQHFRPLEVALSSKAKRAPKKAGNRSSGNRSFYSQPPQQAHKRAKAPAFMKANRKMVDPTKKKPALPHLRDRKMSATQPRNMSIRSPAGPNPRLIGTAPGAVSSPNWNREERVKGASSDADGIAAGLSQVSCTDVRGGRGQEQGQRTERKEKQAVDAKWHLTGYKHVEGFAELARMAQSAFLPLGSVGKIGMEVSASQHAQVCITPPPPLHILC